MATIGTLGTDPDYASLYGARHDPRLLMAQKLMDLGTAPTNNSTQSSFWANLLNQGARGALGGYLMDEVKSDAATEAAKQKTEAEDFFKRVGALPPLGASSPKDGSGGTAPAAPAPGPRADAGGGGGGGDLAQAVLMNESGGRMTPGIYGDGGQAAGPMQVHPGALADVNRAQGTNYTHEQLAADPALGKKVGEAYLAQLRQQFGRDDYALGAYNAGPGTMRAAIANGQGIGGLPPGAQQYVAKALSRMQGRQADASPPPGSNLDALMAGVNQPKPRGQMLAENLLSGTATDAPTPILPDMGDAQGTAAPRLPVASAALDAPGAAAPAMPSPAAASVSGANLDLPPPPDAAALPLPSPAVASLPDPATTPPIAAAVPPRADVPVVPAPDAASVPDPALGGAVPTPAVVPQPDAAIASPPPTPALVPDNPLGRADPASLAAFNGAPPAPTPAVVPPPDAAAVPPPTPAVVPPSAAATLPPQYGPPVPPGLLARKLVQPNDNASDALNTASLAAARAGQDFDPRAPTGPTGPQLAAPLMSWAGQLTDAGAPLLTPAGGAGGPTGPQLAGPLVTPTSGPGDAGATPPVDTSAAGGPNKGAAPASQSAPSSAGLQDRADQLAALAQEAAGSSNPRIRAYAGVLQAQSAALQRRVDHFDTLTQQQQARRDAQADRDANRTVQLHDLEGPDGKVHTYRFMPDGSRVDQGLAANQRAKAEPTAVHTVKLRGDDGLEHEFIVKPDGTKTDLGPSKGEGSSYSGTGLQQQDSSVLDRLHDKIKNNSASEDEKRQYSRAYNRLQNGTPTDVQDPRDPSRNIRIPGTPTDLTGYAPPPYKDATVMPGKPPTEGERKVAGFARRMDLANNEIEKLGSQSFGDVAAGKVPMVGNYLTSNQGQQFQTAAKAWVLAKLRTESGAAFGEGEWEREFSTYFPQPGDTPDRIALKKRLRDMETENMRRDAGNAYTAEKAAPDGNAALAAARKELGPNATDDAIIGRARELMNGK
jgi:hypothetical protein